MPNKVKYKVSEVRVCDLDDDDVMYTKRIIPFIRKVTIEEILDNLHHAKLLTKDISLIIKA